MTQRPDEVAAQVRARTAGEQVLRASDAERDEVVQRLNAAVGEGRLTLAEFSDRGGQRVRLAYPRRAGCSGRRPAGAGLHRPRRAAAAGGPQA